MRAKPAVIFGPLFLRSTNPNSKPTPNPTDPKNNPINPRHTNLRVRVSRVSPANPNPNLGIVYLRDSGPSEWAGIPPQ